MKTKMTREELCEYLASSRIEHTDIMFENIIFECQDLHDIAFMDCSFVKCEFNLCNLAGSNFSYSTFNDVSFQFCNMTDTNLANCHFAHPLFFYCRLVGVPMCYSVLKHGGFIDCAVSGDMTQSYQNDISYTRGILCGVLTYSTLIDVSYHSTTLDHVDFTDVDACHMTMDEVTLFQTDVTPIIEDVTVYEGSTKSSDTPKEFCVHLSVNTKGEASVTLCEEV